MELQGQIVTGGDRSVHDNMQRFGNHHLPRHRSSGFTFRLTARDSTRGANIRTSHGTRGWVGERRVVGRPGRRALGLMASGATCVQKLDGSRDSAIHTKYRILLRSSSMREPRYPLPRVVLVLCKNLSPIATRAREQGV